MGWVDGFRLEMLKVETTKDSGEMAITAPMAMVVALGRPLPGGIQWRTVRESVICTVYFAHARTARQTTR